MNTDKRNLQLNTLLLLLLASSIMSGCASITRGTTQALEVQSEPSGASVLVTRTNDPLTSGEIENNMADAEAEGILESDQDFYGPLHGTTPAVFKLKREGEYDVEISKEGYKTATVKVTHETAGAGAAGMAGNVLVGGIIGVAVDANTGATQDLVPNPVTVVLEKE